MRARNKSPHSMEWSIVFRPTSLGPLCLYFTERGLTALEFDCPEPGTDGPPPQPSLLPMIDAVKKELAAYFAGVPTDFAALTLDPRGTPFQLRVWQELRRIPRGETISYRELAARVGTPKASRAVGQANAANPIPLLIPCHRVIASDGSLGGYSSGLDRKRWLLKHEGVR
jgi:O-6-methylguanine DNA methyltransferase